LIIAANPRAAASSCCVFSLSVVVPSAARCVSKEGRAREGGKQKRSTEKRGGEKREREKRACCVCGEGHQARQGRGTTTTGQTTSTKNKKKARRRNARRAAAAAAAGRKRARVVVQHGVPPVRKGWRNQTRPVESGVEGLPAVVVRLEKKSAIATEKRTDGAEREGERGRRARNTRGRRPTAPPPVFFSLFVGRARGGVWCMLFSSAY
jgi:hypothetical protein